MWRQPQISEINVPDELKEKMREGVFYNSEGNLIGADLKEIVEGIFVLFTIWISSSLILSLMVSLIFDNPRTIQILLSLIILLGFLIGFIRWGWSSYEENWYHFDHENKILTVVKTNRPNWRSFEVPYEQISKIEWRGGQKGRAFISTGSLSFPTNRAGSKRYSSVTEMWSDLARINARMTRWNYNLECIKCKRVFGHHIGTVQCPFDNLILIDKSVKGRIDPIEQHPDDLDRI